MVTGHETRRLSVSSDSLLVPVLIGRDVCFVRDRSPIITLRKSSESMYNSTPAGQDAIGQGRTCSAGPIRLPDSGRQVLCPLTHVRNKGSDKHQRLNVLCILRHRRGIRDDDPAFRCAHQNQVASCPERGFVGALSRSPAPFQKRCGGDSEIINQGVIRKITPQPPK